MADQQQTSIPQHMLRRLQTYFRDTRSVAGLVRCVVTESEECTWHHLNHDRNDHRLSNIVPLIQRLNTNLYNAREDFNRLDSRLDCASLRSKARTAFWEVGQVAQAYGCTRIEYYVAEYCKKPISYRLNCARQMLYYARHRLNYNILGQLLKDTILEPLEQPHDKVCPEVIRSLLQEFESLLTAGGEAAEAFRLYEHSRPAADPRDPFIHTGAIRRSAQTFGMTCGPTKEVLTRLDESAKIIPGDANQNLNVVHTKAGLFIGEHSSNHYQQAMDVVSEAYQQLLAPRISVVKGRVWPKSKSRTLPIRATPSNIADVSLMQAVTLALTKPHRWKILLPETICVARHYWELAGGNLEGPGRGTWKRVTDSFDSTDTGHCELAKLISDLAAPRLPSLLLSRILEAAGTVAAELRTSH